MINRASAEKIKQRQLIEQQIKAFRQAGGKITQVKRVNPKDGVIITPATWNNRNYGA